MIQNKIRYAYIRNENNTPLATIAYEVDRQSDSIQVKYAFAIRNPADDFDRKRGLTIAAARLQKRPINFKVAGDSRNYTIVQSIIENLSLNEEIPTRIRNAAQNQTK